MKQTIIFFDIDSTLVENQFSRKVIRQLLHEIAEQSGQPMDALGRQLWQENTRRQQEDPDHPLTMDWRDILAHIARQHGVTPAQDLDVLWQEAANAQDVLVHDAAHTMLEMLQAPHRKLIIATKGLYKYQQPVLDVVGLTGYFEDILTPDKTGYLKTTPDYFHKYINEEALFIQVGDHYYDDVICARRNGFKAILRAPIEELKAYDPFDRVEVLSQYFERISTYPDSGSPVRPDAVVLSLQEVPAIVQTFEANYG